MERRSYIHSGPERLMSFGDGDDEACLTDREGLDDVGSNRHCHSVQKKGLTPFLTRHCLM